MWARISLAPSAQLSPIENGAACRTEIQNASGVCPDSMRPDRSVMVPDTMTGTELPRASNSSAIANSAALALRVSNTVSSSRMSTPPSSSPLACSPYASRNSSKLMARKPGLLTSGEIDAVRLVGPMAPATKRGRPSSRAATAAASLARRAPVTLSSVTKASAP